MLGRPRRRAIRSSSWRPGAGRGRLAADVLASWPRCSPALRYVLVERSDARRAEQRDLLALEPVEDALGPLVHDDADTGAVVAGGLGPIATSLAELPAIPVTGVVLANELLDNLPFRMVERTADGWSEVRVGGHGDAFEEDLVRAAPTTSRSRPIMSRRRAVPVGTRLPVPTGIREWLQSCAFVLRRGASSSSTTPPTRRSSSSGASTVGSARFVSHERGVSPLVAPGEQDITADVPLDYLIHAAGRAGLALQRDCSQAEWLRDLGIDDLVTAARVEWDERAHIGDLEALRHRSRVTEAAALVDPAGLGGHRVLLFKR